MSEYEPTPDPTVVAPTLDDVESYRRMQAKGWLDAYPNEEAGVSEAWVRENVEGWLTPEALEISRQRVAKFLENPHIFLYVAKVGDESVGMVNATNHDNTQRIEALYVDKSYYGKGTAQALMDTAMSHLDPTLPITLEVVAYNQRAQRFYEKYGFAVVPGSEHLFREVMPSVVMIKPGGEG